MTTETVIALIAALAFGAATAAVAILNYQANAAIEAFAPKRPLMAAYAQNRLPGYDAGGAAMSRWPLTRTCMPPKQQPRC